jgi:hypothetical protein
MPRRPWVSILFYAGLAALMLLIWSETLARVLPGGVADRVSHNSEGVLLALLLAAWIQFVRPRLRSSRYERAVTGAVAGVSLAGALALLVTDLPSAFKTLNEPLIAAALLVPYLQLRRPLGRWPQAVAAVLLLVVVVGHGSGVVVALAETLGMLILAPVAFDIVDRGILDPAARTSRTRRWTWYALLVAAPLAFSLVGALDPGGAWGDFNGYAIRTIEAFLAFLLVEVYFAVGLGRSGVSADTVTPRPRDIAGRPSLARRG